MIAWALIDDVRIDSKMQRKRKKKTVRIYDYRMIDQDNDIKLSKRNLMVAHELFKSGFAVSGVLKSTDLFR